MTHANIVYSIRNAHFNNWQHQPYIVYAYQNGQGIFICILRCLREVITDSVSKFIECTTPPDLVAKSDMRAFSEYKAHRVHIVRLNRRDERCATGLDTRTRRCLLNGAMD